MYFKDNRTYKTQGTGSFTLKDFKKSEKIKVAIFTTDNLIKPDAASLIVNEPLKHLVKFKDLEIYLIAPNDIPDDIKNGLKHIRYTMYNKPILRFLSAYSAIPKLLREDCNLYHCIGEKAMSVLLIAQKIKRDRSPILYSGFEVTGTKDMESKILGKKSLKNKIIGRLNEFRRRMSLKHSHAMIVPVEASRDYIVKHNIYKKRIFVVPPYAVNLGLFGREYERDLTLVNKLGLGNKRVIMYTGEITALHGVSDLIKAMEIINNKIEDVVLVIVGDGSWAPMIKEYVKKKQIKNVVFTGRVPHENIPYYHSIAYVLVIPHVRRIDSELLYPSKLLECLASGKPIVSSNLKAIADVVGDNAILVEPENPQAFADGILKLLNNEELAKKIGENGKKIIYNYSWEETAKRTYEAYKDLWFSSTLCG